MNTTGTVLDMPAILAAQQAQIDDLNGAVELQQSTINLLLNQVDALTRQLDTLTRR